MRSSLFCARGVHASSFLIETLRGKSIHFSILRFQMTSPSQMSLAYAFTWTLPLHWLCRSFGLWPWLRLWIRRQLWLCHWLSHGLGPGIVSDVFVGVGFGNNFRIGTPNTLQDSNLKQPDSRPTTSNNCKINIDHDIISHAFTIGSPDPQADKQQSRMQTH